MGESILLDGPNIAGTVRGGYRPCSSARARCLARVSSDILSAADCRWKDFGGSVEIPLMANLGGEGGRSASAWLLFRAEYGIAGHAAPPTDPGLLLKESQEV